VKRHVIVGNSHAGTTAIEWMRRANDEDEIILISREDCPAYSPALTTHYLGGHMSYDEMFYVDDGFYQKHAVKTMRGKAVVRVDSKAKTVYLEDDTAVPYDDLLIATGSLSLVPPIEGAQLPGVLTLWTADDALRVNEAAADAKEVAVIGGGLIGIQSTNAMFDIGKKVTQIEMLGQVMPAAMDADGSRVIEAHYRKHGVDLRLNERVMGIREEKGRKLLSLASGGEVSADLVVMAAGVKPNIAFLEGSGVEISRGILVDNHCQTNIEGIYAAGDVAESVNAVTGQRQINAIIPNAAEQGRVAGLNMAGNKVPNLRSIALNTFAPLGLSCASVGVLSSEEAGREAFIRQDGENYRKLIFEGDRLVGAVMIGYVDEAGLLGHMIEMQESRPDLKQELIEGNAFLAYVKLTSAMV
jgi:NAD(P)H-nitrite reductase large subunit